MLHAANAPWMRSRLAAGRGRVRLAGPSFFVGSPASHGAQARTSAILASSATVLRHTAAFNGPKATGPGAALARLFSSVPASSGEEAGAATTLDTAASEEAAPQPIAKPPLRPGYTAATASLSAVDPRDANVLRTALRGFPSDLQAREAARQRTGMTSDAWTKLATRFRNGMLDEPLRILAPQTAVGGEGSAATPLGAAATETLLTVFRGFVEQAARAVADATFRRKWYVDACLPLVIALKQAEAAHSGRTFQRLMRDVGDMRHPHTWYSVARSLPEPRRVYFHAGPTNSGKTYHALQSLKRAGSGVYCGPLRLLALEVFEAMNLDGVPTSLRTGQERREIPFAGHASVTVEMVDVGRVVDVAVIDEIQMIADTQRGASWTRAFLGMPARELHVCGDPAAEPVIRALAELCGDRLEVRHYTRLTPMTPMDTSLGGDYAKVQPGDCVVAFSRRDIHAIRRTIEQSTKLKCCVIYGQLPPETRSQQARLFNDPNSGHDVLVASDAIGMGLNLNIRRVIFHDFDKFDGRKMTPLAPDLVKQIAGRAGRASSAYKQGYATTLVEEDLPYLHKCLATPTNPITKAGIFPTSEHLIEFSRRLPEFMGAASGGQQQPAEGGARGAQEEGSSSAVPPDADPLAEGAAAAVVIPKSGKGAPQLKSAATFPLKFVPAALPEAGAAASGGASPTASPSSAALLYSSVEGLPAPGLGEGGEDEEGDASDAALRRAFGAMPAAELLPGTASLAASVTLEQALTSDPFAERGGIVASASHNQLHAAPTAAISSGAAVGPPPAAALTMLSEAAVVTAATAGAAGPFPSLGRGVPAPGSAASTRASRMAAALEAIMQEEAVQRGASGSNSSNSGSDSSSGGASEGEEAAAPAVAPTPLTASGFPLLWTPVAEAEAHRGIARLDQSTLSASALAAASAASAGGVGNGGVGRGDASSGSSSGGEEVPLAEVIERFVEACHLEGPYFMCRSDAALEVARLIQPFPLTLAQRCCLSLVPIGLRMLDVRRYFLRYLTEYSNGQPVKMNVQLPYNDVAYVMRDLESLEGKILAIDAYLWLGQRLGTLWFPDVDEAMLKRKEAGALLEQTLVATSEQIKMGWRRKAAAKRGPGGEGGAGGGKRPE